MTTIRLSFLFSFAEKYAILLISTASAMVLGRVLTPAEIGAYSMGAALGGLSQVLRDFGVGQYLVQEKELTRDKLRAALATSLAAAWLVALLLLAGAAPLARFYAAPALERVLQVLAVNLMLIPFTAVSLPCLRRQMRFAAIFAINLANALAQLACSIGLAVLGYGSLSLAWGALAGTVAALLASLCFRQPERPWLPGWRGIRRVLSFGSYAVGGGIIDEIGVSAPDLIVGKIIGLAGAGMYSKAQGLINLFSQAITSAVAPVIFPLFAAQARSGADLREMYFKTVSWMTALAWPFFTFLALMALPIIRVLYGEQWDAAVPLVRVMCAAAALYSVFNMARYLLVALGEVKAQARLDALTVPVRLLALLVAAPLGLDAVAWAVVAGAVFRAWLTWRYLARLADLRLPALLRAVQRSAVLAGVSALAPLAVLATMRIGSGQLLLPLFLAGAGTLLLWLSTILLLKHELAAEIGLLGRRLMPWRSPS